MYLKQFFVDGIGHASYLIGSDNTQEAAVIDPRRDVDVYVQEAATQGLRIRYVLETHNHNDFLSGARALAERFGAEHVASADAHLGFQYHPVWEGDELTLGELRIRVLSTPGHTPEHVTYVVIDTARAEEPVLVFTGGDLLVGTVGRPDLLGRELGEKLAPMLFDSLHEKILKLEDYVEVLPTHGSGSLCGRGIGSKRTSTIGYERRFNEALRITNKDEFVRHVLEGNPGIPTYYRRMRPANQEGVPAWRLPEPHPLSVEEVQHFAGHGAVILDTRPNAAFGGGHIPGSTNIGLDASLATWVGWLLNADDPILLVMERDDQWADVVTSLARIGYENVLGYLQGGIGSWMEAALPVAHIPQWSVRELNDYLRFDSAQVLDVRMDSEWDEGHIEDAVHISLDKLPERLESLDLRGPTAVICGSGYRSSIAVSLLQQHGFRNVANVLGGMSAWDRAILPKVKDMDGSRRPEGIRAELAGDAVNLLDRAA